MNQCDVVIVNFNTGEVLKDAVASVLRSQSVAHVYVVDNASADFSLDFLPRDQGDRLTVIRNQANLGYAAACNIGLSRATSDNVLLFNPDAEAAEGAIERLITVLGSGERIGMVGPLLLNSDGSEQAGGRRKFPMPQIVLAHALGTTWLGRRLPGLARPPHLHALPDKPTEVELISGACMMVRRAAVAAVGPLDERYFLHCEDLDSVPAVSSAGLGCSVCARCQGRPPQGREQQGAAATRRVLQTQGHGTVLPEVLGRNISQLADLSPDRRRLGEIFRRGGSADAAPSPEWI